MARAHQSVTLRKIAQLAHTSKSTVSRVLTNQRNVAPKTRQRVLEVIEKCQFKPNLFARGLAGGRTGLIGVLAAEINSGFFAEVLKGVDAVAARYGSHVLTSFAHGHSDYYRLWSDMARARHVDGILLIAPSTGVLDRPREEEELPLALCACRPPRASNGWENVDCAVIDNEKGFSDVMNHLYQQQRRHFLFLAGPDDIWDAAVRRRSVEAYARVHPDIILDVAAGNMTRENGRCLTLRYLERSPALPQAIVATNDAMALGALEALRARNIAVPQQVAVVGCDDEPAAALIGLSTLHMPMVELGRAAASLLFERLENKTAKLPGRIRYLPMTLQVRHTSLGN